MDESLREKFSRDLFVDEVRKWEDLPTDCLVNIFERVDMESLIEYLPFVCKSWYKASLSPQCWKILDFSYLDEKYSEIPLSEFCIKLNFAIKFAVHCSCGKASKVVLPCFFPENCMQCVLDKCAELKLKQIYKWKDLESLSLYNACNVMEILTEIHTHCRKFVSFTVKDADSIELAPAIVKFAPNIKHLVLSRCEIEREDLILILSGCRELEFLDVTYCTGFDADDAEILTMASHIKTFMSEGSVEEDEYEYYSDNYSDSTDYAICISD